MNGIDVLHTWHLLSKKSTFFSRAAENLTFGVSSSLALALHDFDVVYVNTWPLFSQFLTTLAAAGRGIPLVVSVQDLYPESLALKGLIGARSWLARLMYRFDEFVVGRARFVIAVSEGMREYLISSRRLIPEKVINIPNWQDDGLFPAGLPRDGAFRKRHGIDRDKFVCMFAGSVTMSAGMELYLNTAALLRCRPEILLVIAGDGSRRKWMEQQISARRLHNIMVVYPLLPKDVSETQAAADVMMLSLTGNTAQNAAPSKLIAYLLSERPVVACVSKESTPARIISEAGAGFVVEPDRPEMLARAIVECAANKDKLGEMGRVGRRYAMERFSRSVLLPRLCDLIEKAGGSSAFHGEKTNVQKIA